MNKEEKLELILQEEEMYHQRRRTELAELRTIFNSPSFAEESFEEPFQYRELEPGAKNVPVYEQEIPSGRAAVIEKIGTEWAPEITLTLKIDNSEKRIEEKDTGNPDNPIETQMLAKKRVLWQASNDKEESFHIGILTDGYYIPEVYYQRLADIYHDAEEMSL